MKRVFGAEILNDTTKEIRTILENQEDKIKQKIEQKTKQLINSFYIDSPQARPKNLKINKSNKNEKSKKQNVNPIITILFVGMTFKSWKKFAERKINNELLNNDSLPEIGFKLKIIYFFNDYKPTFISNALKKKLFLKNC